jgi:hypothetical protein
MPITFSFFDKSFFFKVLLTGACAIILFTAATDTVIALSNSAFASDSYIHPSLML